MLMLLNMVMVLLVQVIIKTLSELVGVPQVLSSAHPRSLPTRVSVGSWFR